MSRALISWSSAGPPKGACIFTTSTAEAVAACEIVFMAVGTPPLPNGEPDLQYLKAASEEVARAMTGYRIDRQQIDRADRLASRGGGMDVAAHAACLSMSSSNPEFLKEGSAVDDFLKPDRVVIGTDKDAVLREDGRALCAFVRQGNPIIHMDPVSAEITKYACNAFLATRISFMNELSVLCEKVGGDVEEVRKGMTTDVRIGKHFLVCRRRLRRILLPERRAGAHGDRPQERRARWGSSPRPKKPTRARSSGLPPRSRTISARSSRARLSRVWGLAFKPNTDDMREAPSLIGDRRAHGGGREDPGFRSGRHRERPQDDRCERARQRALCSNAYEALEGADALVIVTEWNEFRHPDFDRVKSLLKAP